MTRAAALDAPISDALIPPAGMLYDGSSSIQQFIDFEGLCEKILIPRAHLDPSSVFLDLG
jgi:hypothetical protein